MSVVHGQTATAISVDLSVPVQADLVVLARLTAATIAGRAGFGVEDIEDLRLAVEELCLSLVGGRGDGRLHLNFECETDAIRVGCTYEADGCDSEPEGEADAPADADDLSLRILDALVDQHDRGTQAGRPSAWLYKRRSDHPASA